MTVAIVRAIGRALDKQDLSRAEMAEVVGQIMDGAATPAQIGGLLVALRMKGETVEEIVGAARAMRARMVRVDYDGGDLLDTCGTGGDGSRSVNISTLSSFIVAGAGVVVAKHGNRAQSSRCGSADVLEALGIAIDSEPAAIARSIEIAGIGFAFAPRFHAATRHAAGPRKELGTRTIFNLLGPLTNPARVRHQVAGVFDRKWCEPLAMALGALGVRRAIVVHGAGGVDEVAVRGETHAAIWDDGRATTVTLTPEMFRCEEVDPAGLAGGDAAYNAAVMRRVLAGRDVARGERHAGILHAAAMTAALGLELLESGDIDLGRLPDQFARARSAALDGSARLVLHKWHEASRAHAEADLSALATRTAGEFAGVE
jgi:anthranilate phosphoribosyltransferase